MTKTLFYILTLTFIITNNAMANDSILSRLMGSKFTEADYLGRWYFEIKDTDEKDGQMWMKLCGTLENFENHMSNFKATMTINILKHFDQEPHDIKVSLVADIEGASNWTVSDGYIVDTVKKMEIVQSDEKVEIMDKHVLSLDEYSESNKVVNEAKSMAKEALSKMAQTMEHKTTKDKVIAFDKNKIVLESIDDDGKKEIETYYQSQVNDGKCR